MSPLVRIVALAAVGSLLGFACGASMSSTSRELPRAGSPQDDGSGLLARASSEATIPGLFRGDRTDGGGPAREHGGSAYGGSAYGGAPYGGTLYGGYRFDWGTHHRQPPPRRSHSRGYTGAPVPRPGIIRGRVTWPRPPRAPAELAVSHPDCDASIPNDTLRVDAHGHVQGAVVYLEDIRTGRAGTMSSALHLQAMQIGGVLRQRRCRFLPHVQIVSPIGAILRMVNDDATPRTWSGLVAGEPVFHVSAARAVPRPVALAREGFLHVRDQQTPASAWVVVASHPYYTITDDSGQFLLDDVPPGSYTLVVWHPPVARDAGASHAGAPIEHRTRVIVRAGAPRSLLIRLPPAR